MGGRGNNHQSYVLLPLEEWQRMGSQLDMPIEKQVNPKDALVSFSH
jgi:hypothetical protein